MNVATQFLHATQNTKTSQPWASGRAVNSQRYTSPLPNVSDRSEQKQLPVNNWSESVKVNHLTSTNQSIQAENNQ
ncbi:hypothetical protein J6590_078756 [Homalodisca vitripennis]|nr:hypothetical protein J6590_078756 [Homalodisca vitripennis]